MERYGFELVEAIQVERELCREAQYHRRGLPARASEPLGRRLVMPTAVGAEEGAAGEREGGEVGGGGGGKRAAAAKWPPRGRGRKGAP
jgi:hypothetical protein